jgi:cyanate permease
MLPMNLFLIAAPLFAGYMFDFTGSYEVPFTTVAVVSFFGSTLFLLLGKPAAPVHRAD